MEYTKNCLTCLYWLGDKEKTLSNIGEYGDVVMDIKDGFPESGGCVELFSQWIEIDIDGDASVGIEVPANFGCISHT